MTCENFKNSSCNPPHVMYFALILKRGHHGRDHMVVGYAISAYHH
jgi:hypothetical protein